MKLTKTQIEMLHSAMMDIDVAQTKIHQVSTSNLGFSLSKPLNILYKELDAHRWLLMFYTGEAKRIEPSEIAEPQSTKAFKNLNGYKEEE